MSKSSGGDFISSSKLLSDVRSTTSSTSSKSATQSKAVSGVGNKVPQLKPHTASSTVPTTLSTTTPVKEKQTSLTRFRATSIDNSDNVSVSTSVYDSPSSVGDNDDNSSVHAMDGRTWQSPPSKSSIPRIQRSPSPSKSQTSLSTDRLRILELEKQLEEYKSSQHEMKNKITSLEKKNQELSSLNNELEELLSRSNKALIDLTYQLDMEQNGKAAMEEMITSLEQEVVSLRGIVNEEKKLKNLNTIELGGGVTVDASAVLQQHMGTTASLREIAEGLCDNLLLLETALDSETLHFLLQKSAVKEDPYSSTKGWNNNKKKKSKKRGKGNNNDDFTFGKPSLRHDLSAHAEEEEEEEGDRIEEEGSNDEGETESSEDETPDTQEYSSQPILSHEDILARGKALIYGKLSDSGDANQNEVDDNSNEENDEDEDSPKYISPTKFLERVDNSSLQESATSSVEDDTSDRNYTDNEGGDEDGSSDVSASFTTVNLGEDNFDYSESY